MERDGERHKVDVLRVDGPSSHRTERDTLATKGLKHENARARHGGGATPVILTTLTARLIGACTLVGIILSLIAPHASAQQTRPGAIRQQTTEAEEEEPTSRPPVLLRVPLGPTLAPSYPGLSSYRSRCSVS